MEEDVEDRDNLDFDDVYVIDEFIVLRHKKFEYDIHLKRIDNPVKLLWWIQHLCEKRWVTNDMIRRLIFLATENMGIKLYEGEG